MGAKSLDSPTNKTMSNEMTNWFTEEDSVEEPHLSKTGEKETPPAPSADDKTNETTPPSEGDDKAKEAEPIINKDEEIPFHKHPRFRALTQENKELKEQIAEINSKMENFASKFTEQETAAQPIPQWFVRLYGEDQDLYSAYKQEEEVRISNMKQSVLSQLEPELKKIEKEEENEKVNSFINSELEAIKEENPGIDTNAVMKVVYEKKLFDENGNLNFRAGAEWIKNNPKAIDVKTETKKEVAGKLATDNSAEPVKKDFVTSQDIAKRDWRTFYKSL